MNLNIHAGMRVLYKENNQWHTGTLKDGIAYITSEGLYLRIAPVDGTEEVTNGLNEIFFDAFPIEDWMRIYKENFMTKEEYINFIEEDDFDKRLENAFVSDGDYGYYPVNKYTRAWLEKQPFDYVVRGA